MSYVRLNHEDADDERWIDAGADAFAIHFAAMVWCDRHLKDGRISSGMAHRVSLAVPAERVGPAIAALLEYGFWRADEGDFVIENFHEHAFPADQVKNTRARWKRDKDRRRQHGIGDHSLCQDPKFCPAISTMDSTVDSTTGGSHLDQTQSDQTRPDRRSGTGSGPAEPPAQAPRHDWIDDTSGISCGECSLPREHQVHNHLRVPV